MIPVRLAFYVLYIVLGAIIVVRLGALGPRWETFSGMLLGVALVALGIYRLTMYARLRSAQRR